MLPADLADGAVSVGTADSCDWQIAADDVPPVAFSLKTIAGSLFVHAAGTAELRVDGHAVGSMWLPVERGARINVGAALIEVGLAGRSRRAQHAQLQRAFGAPFELDAPAPPAQYPFELGAPAQAGSVTGVEATPSELGSAVGGGSDDVALQAADDVALQAAPAVARDPALDDWTCTLLEEADEPRALARETLPPCEQLWSATIFGAEELPARAACAAREADTIAPYVRWGGASLWIAGSLLACAYGCWVLLLDHL